MTGPAFDKIVRALEAAGRPITPAGPGRVRTSCPAHDGDNKTALSVMDTESRVNITCHSYGCEPLQVLEAIGLTVRDRYHEPRGDNLAQYLYPGGYKVTRKTGDGDGKGFVQSSGWAGRKRPLYRGDRVADAVAAGRPVFLVEGEEDVHAVEAVGGVAVSAPQGARNFQHADLEPLRGAQVVAIADRDEPGRDWAKAVAERLAGVAASLVFKLAKTGKDVADHLAAGHTLEDLEETQLPDGEPEPEAPARRARLTRASDIKMLPTSWLWQDEGRGRLPIGALALAAGREGTGKSSFGIWLAAQLTRGTLPGMYYGKPKPVFYVAIEDSWPHTMNPRLEAAGANRDMVYRFDVVNELGDEESLSLPVDIGLLESEARRLGAALIVVDPLISTVAGSLDTHKERDVRKALDPLAMLAARVGMSVLGIVHFNKGKGTDIASLITGSGAFKNVPRAILGFAAGEEGDRVMTQVKNSLGVLDLPSLGYTIESAEVPLTQGEVAEVGRFAFPGIRDGPASGQW